MQGRRLTTLFATPVKRGSEENLGRARAVLIAPQIVRAGFIFGGSGGRALLVARDGKSWAGPAFYNLATVSVGFQAGVDVSEAIIVVMTDKGLNALLSSSFKIGGDASIAAGPVGAGAMSTVTADLITFTRAKGVYGGLNLDGTVVNTNCTLERRLLWPEQCIATGHLDPQDRNNSEVVRAVDRRRTSGEVNARLRLKQCRGNHECRLMAACGHSDNPCEAHGECGHG